MDTNDTTPASNQTVPAGSAGHSLFSVIHSLETSFVIPYVIIAVLAVAGNIIIIYTISVQSSMKSLHYRLILNMAASDLIFVLISPVHVYWQLHDGGWFLGDFGCKLFYFVFRCLYAFSVLALIVITVERFVAVRFPIGFRQRRVRPLFVLSAVWVVSAAFSAPLIPVHKQFYAGTNKYCFQHWSSRTAYNAYHVVIYLVLYVIPMLVMTVLYAIISLLLWRRPPAVMAEGSRSLKTRRRKARMVMLLVLAFFLCWTPWSIFECMVVFNWAPSDSRAFFLAMNYSMLLVFASAAVNPILYGLLSEEIRQAVRYQLGRCCPRMSTRVHPQVKNDSMFSLEVNTTNKTQHHHPQATTANPRSL